MSKASEDALRESEESQITYSYMAPEPNFCAVDVSELKFGRRDYTEVEMEFDKKRMKLKKRGKDPGGVRDWWKDLNDEYPMMPIYENPEFWQDGTSYINPGPWNPVTFQDMLLNDIDVLSATMLTAVNTRRPDLTMLMKRIERLFKSTMIPTALAHWQSVRCELTDYYVERMDFFESLFVRKSSIIVARFMLGLYFIEPDYWTEKVSLLTDVVDKIHIPDVYSKTGSKFTLKPRKGKTASITVDGISKSGSLSGVSFKGRRKKEDG